MGEREFEAFGITASQAFGAVAVAPAAGQEFRGSVQVLHAGDVRVGDIRSSPLTVSRSASLIRSDDTELYKLALSFRGRAVIDQDGRCTVLMPSDLVIYDTTRPYEFTFPGNNRLLVVGIPRRMLGVPRGLASSITARRLTTTGGTSRVVASFLRTVHAELEALSGGVNEQRLAALLADMLDLMLGDLGVRRTELPAPMLDRVLVFCDVNLSDPTLSAISIARTHRVSVRYLHKLFATVDETPAGYIRRRRLELVRRDLANPELAGVPVARLATRHGLSDAPHFSRLFRATYGCTPGDYRATALTADSLLLRPRLRAAGVAAPAGAGQFAGHLPRQPTASRNTGVPPTDRVRDDHQKAGCQELRGIAEDDLALATMAMALPPAATPTASRK